MLFFTLFINSVDEDEKRRQLSVMHPQIQKQSGFRTLSSTLTDSSSLPAASAALAVAEAAPKVRKKESESLHLFTSLASSTFFLLPAASSSHGQKTVVLVAVEKVEATAETTSAERRKKKKVPECIATAAATTDSDCANNPSASEILREQ
ncbi:hypothetical protein TYRP_011789 [Tyrophagus putrescentiae]|nr:hypothetical protein TYRP_011789 [Tyrophagus putrescentiae]